MVGNPGRIGSEGLKGERGYPGLPGIRLVDLLVFVTPGMTKLFILAFLDVLVILAYLA
jgi:hypothetical protein